MGLYLTIFEHQSKFLNIPEKNWTAFQIGSLPPDIAQLIAREDADDAQNYEKVKSCLNSYKSTMSPLRTRRFHMMTDGIRQTIMALSTVIHLYIEGKAIPTEFLLLPEVTGNKTLEAQYKFFKKTSEDIVLSTFELLQNEGKHLSAAQARKLKILLDKNETCFQPGGEPTPFIEHRIDTAAPVVLDSKPNGKACLCVDYRNLNSVTKVDTYPLPQMDDLMNEATPTTFMPLTDLQSGYLQVKVADAYQDKTAFIRRFGTNSYLRMPFGLQNPLTTFQRLTDQFRSGLKDVFALSYLDDIIVL
ncbi:retrovirus-related Pol polyprotein from transposon 297 [Trichonephila clavipes]|nr:retrovirus-related Pol polyprotein from transposon 297 [Trichonephila clavipes]